MVNNLVKKNLERAIRQEREERRIIKRQKMESEIKTNIETHRNLAEFKKQGRNFTLSIAIPGSIIGNVQSKELKTYVAGQVFYHFTYIKILKVYNYFNFFQKIARASTLFCVDEIIVYNDYALEDK